MQAARQQGTQPQPQEKTMIVRGQTIVTQRNIEVTINFHSGHGHDSITINSSGCVGFSTTTHLSVADAIQFRDALNEVIGEQQ
jgi:hypothetical protein